MPLVPDRTVEAARVERLSTDAVDADDSLAAYQLTEISVGTGLQLWGLGEAMLRANPRMGEVLEQLRQDRRLPEYADFPAFKNEQLRLFTTQIEPVEEMVRSSGLLQPLILLAASGGASLTRGRLTAITTSRLRCRERPWTFCSRASQ